MQAAEFLVGLFVVIVFLICCCRCCRRKPREVVREVHTIERISSPERIVERQKIVERVLVVCPYCGHKNEQGIAKCAQCGADL